MCGKCKELHIEQRPLSYYLGDECECWYGDAAALRRVAQGCPLCMLAAKIAADKGMWEDEKWRDFDYQVSAFGAGVAEYDYRSLGIRGRVLRNSGKRI